MAPFASAALPDVRGWELVSPPEKGGASVAGPGEIAGGGVLQAAAAGDSAAYGSPSAFGPEAQGAPLGAQYLAQRSASGWASEDLSTPLFSGTYGSTEGVPYQLFSPDLSRALLFAGRRCRSVGEECPLANPPLPGTEAPAGYENYYLRASGSFEALLGSGDLLSTELGPAQFELTFAGASPDLTHAVLSSCAALTPTASEVPLGEGCDPAKANLYERSGAGGLTLINAAPGAALAAQAGAVSENGSRVYFTEAGNLFLREGTQVKQVDAVAGGGGTFQVAAANGSLAYFTKAGALWRYEASSNTATEIASGVSGIFGASNDGSRLYFLSATGLHLWSSGTVTDLPTAVKTASAAEPSDFPPSTGTARVSPSGSQLLFTSTKSLTGYDNTDQRTGLPDTEAFLYSAPSGQLRCVSCRTSGIRPIGSSTIPGAERNGTQATATHSYKPRALSTDGSRVFFDSTDALASGDSNNAPDVYQWEAQGPNCTKAAGCISLLSSGRGENGATFADASASGDDTFFLTGDSLVGTDPGSIDLYDARVGGGFPEALVPIPCFGDSCQSLPSEPSDPGLSTQVVGPGNPKVHYVKHGHAKKHKKKTAAGKKGKKRGGR